MIDHYNAFISYRHADKDIKIASAIQHDLEHFHIPGKIKKSTGIKSINRIFLDKDELGAASDLSEEISYALTNADHLIVICSTSTKESAWVPREIEYFLRNHTRQQITTVLADGEPEDVIPDILKHEERVYQNEYGEQYTVTVPLEPLSCDYRLPRKKAKKEELPRLASKLLGCSYDELMNRRRQYRIRRLSIIFSAILLASMGFVAYLLYSQSQIQKNYEKALRNQSRYLANESTSALDRQDRILALELALAALPKDDSDKRPVTPEAIRALTDSTLAYTTSHGLDIETLWKYETPDRIAEDGTILSADGKYLASYDIQGNFRVWDTSTHKETISIAFPEGVSNLQFLPNGKLLVWSSKKMELFTPSDGTRFWSKSPDGKSLSAKELIFLKDGSFLISDTENILHQISWEDGSEVKTISLPKEVDGTPITIMKTSLSPDETRMALSCMVGGSEYYLGVFSLSDGKFQTVHVPKARVRNIFWADDSHLLYTESDSNNASMSFGGVSVVKTDVTTIRCVEPQTLKETWKYDFVSTNVMYESGFFSVPKRNAVLYYCANKAEVLQISDGKLLSGYNMNSSIVSVMDPDGDGYPFVITNDGELCFTSNDNSVQVFSTFKPGLSWGTFQNSFFISAGNSNSILEYGVHVTDDEWTSVSDWKDTSSSATVYKDNQVIAVFSDEDAAEHPEIKFDASVTEFLQLTLVQSVTGEVIYRIPLNPETYSSLYRIAGLGSTEGHFYFLYNSVTDGCIMGDVNLGTGEIEEHKFDENLFLTIDSFSMSGDRVFYYGRDENKAAIIVMDPKTKEETAYPIHDDVSGTSTTSSPIYLPALDAVFFSLAGKSGLYFFNGDPVMFIDLPDGWLTKDIIYNDSLKKMAITDGSQILLFTPGEKEMTTISCPAACLGLSFFTDDPENENGILLADYISGDLYRYGAADGSFIGKSTLTGRLSSQYPADFSYDSGKKLLYIKNEGNMSIVDTEEWIEETYISNCIGYHELKDIFYTTQTSEKGLFIGYFKHYTTDDLIAKAKAILKDKEMSEETKSVYGIDTP